MSVFFYLMIMSFTYLTVHSEMETKCDCSELAVIKEMMQQILFENKMESTRLKILEAKQRTASHKNLSPVSNARLERLEQNVDDIKIKLNETIRTSREQQPGFGRNFDTIVKKMLKAEKKERTQFVTTLERKIMEYNESIETFKIAVDNSMDAQFKHINVSQTEQSRELKEGLAAIENMTANSISLVFAKMSTFQKDSIVEINRRLDGIQNVSKSTQILASDLITVNESVYEARHMITSLDKLVKDEKEWSPWSTWGECSDQCVQGVRERNRTCASTFGCIGNSKDISICRPQACVRLVSGSNGLEGRLEVFHDGEWGTVCDDAFDKNDARVVCKMLGIYSDVVHVYMNAHFGAGTLPIMLDEVSCNGSESSIFLCSHYGWKKHNCAHSEDVGIKCGS